MNRYFYHEEHEGIEGGAAKMGGTFRLHETKPVEFDGFKEVEFDLSSIPASDCGACAVIGKGDYEKE